MLRALAIVPRRNKTAFKSHVEFEDNPSRRETITSNLFRGVQDALGREQRFGHRDSSQTYTCDTGPPDGSVKEGKFKD